MNKKIKYFFLLEKRAFLKIERNFKSNLKTIWLNKKKNILSRFFLTLLSVQFLFFKLSFFLFMNVFYIFIYSTFGKVSFFLGLSFSFGFAEKGYPWFLLFYFGLLIDSFFIYLLCCLVPTFEKWIYDSFGSKLVVVLCGNTPMRYSVKAIVGAISYYGLRTTDSIIADKRIEINANREAEFLKRHQNLEILSPEALRALWEKHEKRVGPGVIHKIENVVTSASGEFLKGLGEAINKKAK